jgi:hypothetical protein
MLSHESLGGWEGEEDAEEEQKSFPPPCFKKTLKSFYLLTYMQKIAAAN